MQMLFLWKRTKTIN